MWTQTELATGSTQQQVTPTLLWVVCNGVMCVGVSSTRWETWLAVKELDLKGRESRLSAQILWICHWVFCFIKVPSRGGALAISILNIKQKSVSPYILPTEDVMFLKGWGSVLPGYPTPCSNFGFPFSFSPLFLVAFLKTPPPVLIFSHFSALFDSVTQNIFQTRHFITLPSLLHNVPRKLGKKIIWGHIWEDILYKYVEINQVCTAYMNWSTYYR